MIGMGGSNDDDKGQNVGGGILGMATGFNPMQPGMGIGPRKEKSANPFGIVGNNPLGAIGALTGADKGIPNFFGGMMG